MSIRGIGGGQPGIWSDNAIGMYLDGVYVGKTQGALLDLLDLERVELLRGSQGTLFGKNTEGGAINFITRKPSGEFGGNVGVEMGTYGHQVVRAALDLPKMGMLRMGFSLRDEQRDGTVDNPTNGRQWNDRNRQAQRVALGLDISPVFKVDYAYDHTHINETSTALSLLSENGYASLYPASRAGKLNPVFGNVLRPVDVFIAGKNTYYDTISHKVQWIGSSDRLNYVAGLYSFKDDGATLTDQMGQYFTFGFAPAKERWLYYRTQTHAKAVYGQLDYKLTRDLTGTLGTNVAVGNSAAESTMPVLQMINARLLLGGIPLGGSGKAEASLWVRNLGNLRKETTHIDVAGLYRVAGWTEPRMMGVSLGYKW